MRLAQSVGVEQWLYDANGQVVSQIKGALMVNPGNSNKYLQKLIVKKPVLWSIENPLFIQIGYPIEYFRDNHGRVRNHRRYPLVYFRCAQRIYSEWKTGENQRSL